MSRIVHFCCFLICVLMAAVFAAASDVPFSPEMPDSSLYAQGRFVYERNCLICHGRWGDGKGEMGKETIPPPRDFGRAIFKYDSTPPGKLPLNADLQRIVRNGLAGTAMPAFNHLSHREVKAVTEYIKTFSGKWRHATNYAPALDLPPVPDWFKDRRELRERAQKGNAFFQQLCTVCHGKNGSGEGASVTNLVDTWGQPVRSPDLQKNQLRSGDNPQDIFRVLTSGIETTPMPSFAEALTEDQRWELAAYLTSLRTKHELAESP